MATDRGGDGDPYGDRDGDGDANGDGDPNGDRDGDGDADVRSDDEGRAPPAREGPDDELPIRGWFGGGPIPDLAIVPEERWREVLRPLRPRTRRMAAGTVSTIAASVVAMRLVGELGIDDAASIPAHVPPAMPAAPAPARAPAAAGRRGRQVSFRLRPGEYARLAETARLYGMRPTSLARAFTVQGADRALHERRRDRDQ